MEKRILDVVSDFSQWKGDTYRLAAIVSSLQKEIDAEKLEVAEMPDAAALVRE